MRAWPLLFVSCVVACSASERTTTSDDEIRGGQVATDDPAVVMVHFASGQFCSGTLVAPDRVLTAGHCLKYVADVVYVGVGVPTTAYDPTTSTSTMTPHAVAGQSTHPDYLAHVKTWGFDRCPLPVPDLGVVKLAAPILDVVPAVLADVLPVSGETCRSVGFGAHRTGRTTYTYQEKRTAQETVSEVKATSIKTRYATGISDKGDSGGALLCGGRLSGVTSCHDDEQDTHRYEVYARFDGAAAWLASEGVGVAGDGGADDGGDR